MKIPDKEDLYTIKTEHKQDERVDSSRSGESTVTHQTWKRPHRLKDHRLRELVAEFLVPWHFEETTKETVTSTAPNELSVVLWRPRKQTQYLTIIPTSQDTLWARRTTGWQSRSRRDVGRQIYNLPVIIHYGHGGFTHQRSADGNEYLNYSSRQGVESWHTIRFSFPAEGKRE